jgi:hypothetical protein
VAVRYGSAPLRYSLLERENGRMLDLQEEGRGKVWLAIGLALLVCVVLVPCVTCLMLTLLGPQIGNVFSGVTSGLEAGG